MIIEKKDYNTLEIIIGNESLEFYRLIDQNKEDFYLYVSQELAKIGYKNESEEVLKAIESGNGGEMGKLVISKNNASFKEIYKIEEKYHEFISKSKAKKFKINLVLEEMEEGETMYKEQEEKIIYPGFENEEPYVVNREKINKKREKKIYEILNKDNINKTFKDNKGDIWKVKTHMDNLVLVLANEGSSRISITKMYYLDEIFELDFVEN